MEAFAPFITNWLSVRDFVPTEHKDSYDYISPLAGDLAGKSVFITGASRGIGRAMAISFARAGASRIAIGGRSDLSSTESLVLEAAAAAAGRQPPQVLLIQGDLASEATASSAATRIGAAFDGSLDVLVNNAGRGHEVSTTIDGTDPGEWWSAWEVNVKGVFLMTRALVPLLQRSGTRTVLNVSSAGAHMLMPNLSGYQTGKMAVSRLTEFWAKDYEGKGGEGGDLLFISLHPGDVLTELSSNVPQELMHLFDTKAELAGDTVAWLARERRPWLNGRFVSVNWDMQELEGRQKDMVDRDLLKFRMTV